MTDLWFVTIPGSPPSRGGDVLYAEAPDGLWAVYVSAPVYEDTATEASQLLGHYGANVAVIGYELAAAGLSLDPALKQWGTARDEPAESIGAGQPTLVEVTGSPHLALSWDFGASRAYATTSAGRHVAILAPAARRSVAIAPRS